MEWIKTSDRLPNSGDRVLVILDYTKCGSKIRVDIASVHFTSDGVRYGGPNALTGSGYLRGIYFAIPAIVHPEIVTHWMPLPEPPKD